MLVKLPDLCCNTHRFPRERFRTADPGDCGYHQMLEELFEAHEERLPEGVRGGLEDTRQTISAPRTRFGMNEHYASFNPASAHLDVDYRCVPLPGAAQARTLFRTVHCVQDSSLLVPTVACF